MAGSRAPTSPPPAGGLDCMLNRQFYRIKVSCITDATFTNNNYVSWLTK